MSVVTEPPIPSEGPARDTVSAYARRWWIDVKSGELGSLPIIVGLIIIAIVFQTQNDRFLTAGNFVNLIVQTAPYAVIAMGVTFALLLGEIDLSIGFVSGVGGVMVALLLAPDGSHELSTAPAMILAPARRPRHRRPARPDHHEGRRAVVRRHARRPARVERRRAAADRQPRHRDPAERLRDRARQRLHGARARVDPGDRVRRGSTRRSSSCGCATGSAPGSRTTRS